MVARAASPEPVYREMLILRGGVAIGVGALLVAWPGIGLSALIAVFATLAIATGVVLVAQGISSRTRGRSGWYVLLGIASLLVGAVTLAAPRVTTVALLWLFAAWALAAGTMEIVDAVAERSHGISWPRVLQGLVSIGFGLLFVFLPVAGALAIVWLIGLYCIAIGLMELFAAWSLKGSADWRRPVASHA